MLLTTGERVSAALLTMALADLGVDAVSFTGSQVGIITDTVHGKAKILEVKGDRVREALADGQGRRRRRLPGRAAPTRRSRRWAAAPPTSRPSALAKALDADACEIYTDVTGVFTADPRIVPRARKLQPRSASTRCSRWPAPAPRCWPCARSSSPATTAWRCTCARRSRGSRARWVTDEPGTTTTSGGSMEDPIISGVVHRLERVQGHRARRPRPPGHLGHVVRAARRGQRQRRHDRPEHVDRGHDRHQLHGAVGRHGRGRGDRQPASPPRSAPTGVTHDDDIAKVSSSAPA